MTARPPVVIVGWGRCGSTMVMRALRAGGIPWADGAHPRSGEHTSPSAAIRAVRPGTVVKLLDPMHPDYRLPAEAANWSFLWIDRDLIQQARSWAKMATFFGLEHPSPLMQYEVRKQWAADREVVMAEKLPGRVKTLNYEQFVEHPLAAAQALADALPEYDLDVESMAAIVHDRKSDCRPDLAAEDALALHDDDDWYEVNANAIAKQRGKLGLS